MAAPQVRRQSTIPPVPPLAVPPKTAAAMLGLGQTTLFKLLNSGELESYTEGSARRILTSSIHAYVQRRLEASRPKKPKT